MKIKIQNRRYIGSKKNFVNLIYNFVSEEFKDQRIIFADFFAGTGVVSHFFAEKGHKVIVNDLLYSNYCVYNAFFSKQEINYDKVEKYIKKLNNISKSKLEFLNKKNYFSGIYGNKYFSNLDAYIIGEMRDLIEFWKEKLNDREYYYLISSLLYSTDKIANTVGHFEHFLSSPPKDKEIKIKELGIINFPNEVKLYNEDANNLAVKCYADVVYLDPPYNSRQYVNFYHVLENLALWKKPNVFQGTSMKFERDHLKSEYSKRKAPLVFQDLINKINAKMIIVSYNNTYKAKSSASNNTISETKLFEILCEKGDVKRYEIDHKFFNAGKTNFKNHKEYIYVCKINKKG